MNKEIPTGAIIGAIAAICLVAGFAIFFFVKKGDPAAQAPNPPPRFDAAQKRQEMKPVGGISFERGPASSGPQKSATVVQ